MTFVAPEELPQANTRIPAVIVLGADALLAALPASPVQLAHACLLAGYSSVVPASWGDELVAAASIRVLSAHGDAPAVQCSCPLVARRLLTDSGDLRPFLISLVAPPVALARYLRSAHGGGKLRITYVGRCPAATDESIDARLTPEELLASFADRGIALEEQPHVFDSVLPPDRRRFRSQPGGVPTADLLWSAGGASKARTFVELHGEALAVELAQHLLSGRPSLLDASTALGCVCSGAVPGIAPEQARAKVVALEPPRARGPVIDERIPVELELPLPLGARPPVEVVSSEKPPGASVVPARGDASERERMEGVVPSAGAGARRHSPPRGIARPAASGPPAVRDASGRSLPRTYIARRRPNARPQRRIEQTLIALHETGVGADALSGLHDTSAPVIAPADALGKEPREHAPHRSEPRFETHVPTALGAAAGQVAGDLALATESAPYSRAVTSSASIDESANGERFRERSVALPVAQRSDASSRQSAARSDQRAAPEHEVAPAARPRDAAPVDVSVMPPARAGTSVLALALLITAIVVVSAAAGVLLGRWMAQH